MPTIHAASAIFPGPRLGEAVDRIFAETPHESFGSISTREIQLCVQHHGICTEDVLDDLTCRYPDTRFRLHANIRVLPRGVMWDASTVRTDTLHYYQRLADLSARIDAPAYTLHAGRRSHCDLETMLVNVRRLGDLFDCPVGVEGLYPGRNDEWLVSTWSEYARLLDSGVPYALDMSHLNIVARHSGVWEDGLVDELLASERCIEIHVSGNDGYGDQHRALVGELPSWWEKLSRAHSLSTIFSEGRKA